MMMDKDILKMSKKQYEHMISTDDDEDEDDIIDTTYTLIRTVASIKKENDMLETNISELSEKLKVFKERQETLKKLPTKDKGTKKQKKQKKKERETILKMIFNNADELEEEKVKEDEENDTEDKPKRQYNRKKKEDKLDSTYGQRFSPVVSLLYDNINDFNGIIETIEDDLASIGSVKSRYKTDQIGNLISANNSKLSAIKELGSISKVISDLEYKKDKDIAKNEEETNHNKAINALGVKFLKGVTEDENKKKQAKNKSKKTRDRFKDDDDDDDDVELRSKKKESDKALANEFANTIFNKKDKLSLTPHERYIDMEGKYKIVVVASHKNPENDWKFVAVDNNGKEIKNFKESYKDLLPKKRGAKLVFDLSKMKVTDKITSKKYKLILH